MGSSTSEVDNTTPRSQALAMALDACGVLAYGEQPVPDMPDWKLHQLLEAASSLRQLRQATSMVISLIDQLIAADVGPGGGARYGDTVYTYTQGVDEKVIDPEAFFDYLEDNPELVRKIVNPNYVKKGSLPKPVRDTFFDRKSKEPSLDARSINDPYLPKHWLVLKDGDVRYGRYDYPKEVDHDSEATGTASPSA